MDKLLTTKFHVLLFLLFSLIVFFGHAIFTGKFLLPMDILYQYPPWNSQAPPDFKRPQNPLLFDQIAQFHPWNNLISQELRAGSWPLWNPYSFCGSPLLANGQAAVLYPLNFFHYFLQPRYSYLLVAMTKLMIAGFFMFLFLKSIRLSTSSALLGGISFMFSGTLIVSLGFPISNVAVFLPLLFFPLERFLQRTNAADLAFFSLFWGIQLLGGQPQTSFCLLFALTIYFLFRLGEHYKMRGLFKEFGARIFAYLIGLILGFMLAAIQMLPFIEYLKLSAAYQLRSEYNVSTFPWYELINFLIPNFFGNPIANNYWGSTNMVSDCCYIGVAPLLLASFAALRWRKIRAASPFLAIAILSLGIIFDMPLFNLFWELPGIKSMFASKFLLPCVFALCVLAALGMEFLIGSRRQAAGGQKLNAGSASAGRNPTSFTLIIIGVVFMVIVVFFQIQFSTYISALRLEAYELKNIAYFSTALILSLFFSVLFLKNKLSETSFALLLILLTFVELYLFGHPFNPAVNDRDLNLKPESLRFLEKDPSLYRVIGLDNVLPPNTSLFYKLQDVRGYDAITPRRFFKFISLLDPDLPNLYKALDIDKIKGSNDVNSSTMFNERIKKLLLTYGKEFEDYLKGANYWSHSFSQILKPKLLDLMNVKYVLVAKDSSPLNLQNYELVYDGEIKIFRNPTCLPRAFFLRDYEIVADEEKVLEILRRDDFNPWEKAIISDPRGEVDLLSLQMFKDENRDAPSVEVTAYEAHKVSLRTKTTASGVLVLADAFYPGWKAYVDGKPQKIFAVDYLFRGVFLRGGEHRVELVYEPSAFKIARAISLLSLVALTVCWSFNLPFICVYLRSSASNSCPCCYPYTQSKTALEFFASAASREPKPPRR